MLSRIYHNVSILLVQSLAVPIFLRTPKQAAECVIFACTGPAEEVGGSYIQDGAVATGSALSNNIVFAQKLWKKSEELSGIS